MNSPEIDYLFLINALYLWEEKYPTTLSKYKQGYENVDDNLKINVMLPPGKDVSTFNPAKNKESKVAQLIKIVRDKMKNYETKAKDLQETLDMQNKITETKNTNKEDIKKEEIKESINSENEEVKESINSENEEENKSEQNS